MRLTATTAERPRPRLGFLGLGWIGLHRMQALQASGLVDIVALADPSAAALDAAVDAGETGRGPGGETGRGPGAETGRGPAMPGQAMRAQDLDDLLGCGIDGLVIATPNALHAGQAIAALEAGVAVFCQKPLGRDAGETARVVAAARAADRLLGLDLSYRHSAGMRAIRDLVQAGGLGEVYALDLTFHNAYGPDKPWFRDRALSGGGCVIDLGVHLVDLAMWLLDFPRIGDVSARLYQQGQPLRSDGIEDYALATLDLGTGATVRIACSWNLHAGTAAEISCEVHGTGGGASWRNIDGSFLEFGAWRNDGTSRLPLALPPDDWGGRAALDWARRLHAGARFDPAAEEFVAVADILDAIYRDGIR